MRKIIVGFGIAIILFFAMSFFVQPPPKVGLDVHKRMTTAEAWAIAANNAAEMGKVDLLKAIYESEIPDAADAVRNTFNRLNPSPTSIQLLHQAFIEGDARSKYHAMHGLYQIGRALGIDMKAQGIDFPAYSIFKADTEMYIAKWQAWLEEGYPELMQRQGLIRRQ